MTATHNLALVFHSIFHNNYIEAGLLRDGQGATLSQYPPLLSEAATLLDLSWSEAAWLMSTVAPYLSSSLCPSIFVHDSLAKTYFCCILTFFFSLFSAFPYSPFLFFSFLLFSLPPFVSPSLSYAGGTSLSYLVPAHNPVISPSPSL